jgi:hypothetical protein
VMRSGILSQSHVKGWQIRPRRTRYKWHKRY